MAAVQEVPLSMTRQQSAPILAKTPPRTYSPTSTSPLRGSPLGSSPLSPAQYRLNRSASLKEGLIRRDSRLYQSPERPQDEVLLFDNDGVVDRATFIGGWKGLAESNYECDVDEVAVVPTAMRPHLARGNVFLVASRTLPDHKMEWYLSAHTRGVYAYIQIQLDPDHSSCHVEVRMDADLRLRRAAALRISSLLKPLPLEELPFKKDYEIKSELGRGPYSVVYLVEEVATGGVCVLKDIDKSNENFDASVFGERLVTIEHLEHKNLLYPRRVYDSPSHYYIVMDYVDGGDMFNQFVIEGVFSEAESACIVRQVLEGLAYMHSHGIVHRDIKLENLLVHAGEVKVSDFNLCARIDPDEPLTQMCGTPGYSAPEVTVPSLREGTGYNDKVDVFATGVVLYILLSGTAPFESANDDEVIAKSERGEWEFGHICWEFISAEAKDLVTRMLATAPADRPTAAEALEHPFFEAHPEDESKWEARKLLDVDAILAQNAEAKKDGSELKPLIGTPPLGGDPTRYMTA